MMKVVKLISLLVVVTVSRGVHADENTQANIVRPQPDSNGVDLVTGGLYVGEPSFSAPAASKLQLNIGHSDR